MTKLKTHKGTAKRFNITGTGKVQRRMKQNRSHHKLRSQRNSVKREDQRGYILDSKTSSNKVKQLLNLK